MEKARRFRKKPVVIEAIRWSGNTDDIPAIVKFFQGAPVMGRGCDMTIKIETLEGEMVASPGDYIIRGVKGELYPCKSDIFEATYEEVSNEEVNSLTGSESLPESGYRPFGSGGTEEPT